MQTASITPRRPLPGHVEVEAHARLHLGFFDLDGSQGRCFGSLGVALDGLVTRVRVRRGAGLSSSGPCAERAAAFARRALEHLGQNEDLAIEVLQALPEHVGLGSGTQLALATGAALARLHGLDWPAGDMATVLVRGQRSGIGIGTFEQGGFVVDGGRDRDSNHPPKVISRLACPQNWRWVLVFDDQHRGLSGTAEKQAFASLPPFPQADAAQLCRTVLTQLLPALVDGDIGRFGQALTLLQDRVGDHFAPAQGGRYASARVASVLAQWRESGAAAVGQTSWGPTGFALVESPAQARAMAAAAAAAQTHGPAPLRFVICATRNAGAGYTEFQATKRTDNAVRGVESPAAHARTTARTSPEHEDAFHG
ncbi:MAG: beta-ribofuranosylaminobenzene 5'-phosphate synthase family protein [Thiomonas sp.]